MAYLPSFRVTAVNKPFKFCGNDYFGPIMYKQNRSLCGVRGLLFACLCTRCVHVEIVTGLDLNNFILAFSRFVNLRGPVDTFFLTMGSRFVQLKNSYHYYLTRLSFMIPCGNEQLICLGIRPAPPARPGRIFPICSTFQCIRLFNPRSLQRHNRKTTQAQYKYHTVDSLQAKTIVTCVRIF